MLKDLSQKQLKAKISALEKKVFFGGDNDSKVGSPSQGPSIEEIKECIACAISTSKNSAANQPPPSLKRSETDNDPYKAAASAVQSIFKRSCH